MRRRARNGRRKLLVIRLLMLLPAWNPAVLPRVPVPLHPAARFERVEHGSEVEHVIREDGQGEHARAPEETALAVGLAPEPDEGQPQGETAILLGFVEPLVHEELGLDGADAAHGQAPANRRSTSARGTSRRRPGREARSLPLLTHARTVSTLTRRNFAASEQVIISSISTSV